MLAYMHVVYVSFFMIRHLTYIMQHFIIINLLLFPER